MTDEDREERTVTYWVPKGSVVTHVLATVLYLDAEGGQSYVVVTRGDDNVLMTTYLGMAEVAKLEVFRNQTEHNDEP